MYELQPKYCSAFCTCSDPEFLLCEECLPKHSKKRTRKGHPVWLISDLHIYKDTRYFEQQEAFADLQEQTRKRVYDVDKAIAEYNALIEIIMKKIRVSGDIAIAQLTVFKTQLNTDMETSLEEVERTLAEPQPRFHSKYGSVFRALLEKPASFQLFTFHSPTCTVPPQSLISFQSTLRLPKQIMTEVRGEPRIAPAVPKIAPQPSQPPECHFDDKKEGAEAKYMELIQICTVHFPQSKQLAICHHNLDLMYKRVQLWKKAEKQLRQASLLYEKYFPKSWNDVICLTNVVDLYRRMKRYGVSEANFLKAVNLYKTHFPTDINYATCLNNLNYFTRIQIACRKLRLACQLDETYIPNHKNSANHLWNLGFLYEKLGQKTTARKRLESAFTRKSATKRVIKCQKEIRKLGSSA